MKRRFTQEQHQGNQITRGQSHGRGHLPRTQYGPWHLLQNEVRPHSVLGYQPPNVFV